MDVHKTLSEADFLFDPHLSLDGRELSPAESRFHLHQIILTLSLELITLSVNCAVAPQALENAQMLVKSIVGKDADCLINYCMVFAELMKIKYEQGE